MVTNQNPSAKKYLYLYKLKKKQFLQKKIIVIDPVYMTSEDVLYLDHVSNQRWGIPSEIVRTFKYEYVSNTIYGDQYGFSVLDEGSYNIFTSFLMITD